MPGMSDHLFIHFERSDMKKPQRTIVPIRLQIATPGLRDQHGVS
jgi:hypothetical protein